MESTEVFQELGFLVINIDSDDFPETQFRERLPLSVMNNGIDAFFDKPLITRKSNNRDLYKRTEDFLIRDMYAVTIASIFWLKENGFGGDIIFHYELRTQFLDYEIICKAYSQRN